MWVPRFYNVTMQLYMIRHAQSENNDLWARTGSSNGRSPDPLLTAVGEQQAHCLGQHIAEGWAQADPENDPHNRLGFHFTHLYTSLMVRAVATGWAIAERVNVPLVAWDIIHETGGIYEHNHETEERIGLPGPNRAYFAQHHPYLRLPESLGEAGWWGERPFEPRDQAMQRAQQFLTELLERHQPDDRVAVITHGAFFVAVMRTLLGFATLDHDEGTNRIWLHAHNTSITRLDFSKGRVELLYLNRLDHLPAELIT